MKFSIYQESRIGGRDNNEDRVAYCYSRDSLLMVVADGMGGHHYGEIAAQIAVQSMTQAFQNQAKPTIKDPFLFLQKGISNAHNAILDYSADNFLEDSPRTTCVACLIQDNVAYWAHAGDSRLYLLRNGRAIAQTRDHTRVRLLIEQGRITELEAETHPERNRVYSCLGSPHSPEIEFSRKTPLEAGDTFVLATDGLWGEVPPEQIVATLRTDNLVQAVPRLLNLAEQRGGPRGDNLSLIVTRWGESYVEEASSMVATQTMPLDSVTTMLEEFGRNPTYKSDLTDDEIENAIAEIRNAIEKYSKK